MRLSHVRIYNYKSCRDVAFDCGDLHALVGSNNAGKSSILRALDLFFNPSATKVSEHSFWKGDTSLTIRVECTFTDLTEDERQRLGPYLRPDGAFIVARTAQMAGGDGDEEDGGGEGKVTTSQAYYASRPAVEWLQADKINGQNIADWWREKETLVVGGVSFTEFMGATSQPRVGVWKEKAEAFIEAHGEQMPMEDDWVPNPQGYAGVLKASLPPFVLIPAVRDVNDESKATKSSPFGKLIYAMIDQVSAEERGELEQTLQGFTGRLNRSADGNRLAQIDEVEQALSQRLGDLFKGCDLELEFETPTIEVVLTSPRLLIDDGLRNRVEDKGHGVQRAVIFSILRCYAELIATRAEQERGGMIIAVEEPELYMHPQAQRTIRDLLLRIAGGPDQVLYTTHSSLLVDVARFDQIIRVTATDCITAVTQLTAAALIEDLNARIPATEGRVTEDSIRELYSHAYSPTRNEGFFASKVILVEGATEQYSLPIYAAAVDGCDLDQDAISVIECNGKGQMDRLYRVFNELGIPCYLIFDYDRDSNDAENRRKSKELLSLCGQPEDAPEQPLVCDRCACLPSNWETDVHAAIDGIENLARDARQLLGLSSDAGKPLVARYVATKLTEEGGGGVPPIVQNILETAVACTWHGSCLQTPPSDSRPGGLAESGAAT